MPRLVLISDTHEKHDLVQLPEGDLLIHAGDWTYDGDLTALHKFNYWLGTIKDKYPLGIVCVPGNHELTMCPKKSTEDVVKKAFKCITEATVLNEQKVTIAGLTIYGSPVTPFFYNWAFNVPRGSEIRKHWDAIPEDVDILVVHGPPLGMLDQARPSRDSEHVGCWDLADVLGLHPFSKAKIKPKVTVFGHIHGSGGKYVEKDGQVFVNASVLDEGYGYSNKPIVVDILADGSVYVPKLKIDGDD